MPTSNKANKRKLDKLKLVKLLGMLGSAHDGEIAAAGRMAHELIRQAKLTWYDVIPVPTFDKTSYQRRYMRKRRAEERRKRDQG